MQEGVEELVERGHDELGALYGCPAWVGSAYAQVHEGRQGDARRNGPAGEEGAVDEEAVEARVARKLEGRGTTMLWRIPGWCRGPAPVHGRGVARAR